MGTTVDGATRQGGGQSGQWGARWDRAALCLQPWHEQDPSLGAIFSEPTAGLAGDVEGRRMYTFRHTFGDSIGLGYAWVPSHHAGASRVLPTNSKVIGITK